MAADCRNIGGNYVYTEITLSTCLSIYCSTALPVYMNVSCSFFPRSRSLGKQTLADVETGKKQMRESTMLTGIFGAEFDGLGEWMEGMGRVLDGVYICYILPVFAHLLG